MTALLPRLLDLSLLSLAELHAARLDGDLYRVGEAFATIDTPDTADLRAAAFRLVAPKAAVADRHTASWIHGARAGPPAPLQVCVDSAHRISATSLRGLDVRQSILSRGDVLRFGDAKVTSPLRTAVDLLRSADRFTPATAVDLQGLLVLAGANSLDCREHLQRHERVLGTRRALERLAALEPAALESRALASSGRYPALTRYTS